jgi:LytS/YehU family sensor histidine kinase
MTISPAIAGHVFELKQFFTWKSIAGQILKLLCTVGYYYYAVNTYYHLIYEKKSTSHYIKYSVIGLIILLVFYTCSLYFIPDQKALKGTLTTPLLVFSFFLSAAFNIGLALLVAYLTYLRDEKKQRKILEEQKLQLEVEKSQANFNFLKAQINPHFLHNTLNFLYAKSLPYSPELSEGILTLSDIMRYALNEDTTKDGKAPLKDEIEHVRNVIKIQQLRFSNKLNVQFDVEGVINSATIIPFVLITLVENAFKHGDLKMTDDPIVIKVTIKENQLYFYCRNKKKAGPKELSTGIGLENIKKRLELAYGKNYSFNVKDEGEFYTTELIINLL